MSDDATTSALGISARSCTTHPRRCRGNRSPARKSGALRDNETGRVQTCELRDDSRAGAGWEVQILEAGEILVSRRCSSEREARYVAEAARKDQLRTGSVPVQKGGAS